MASIDMYIDHKGIEEYPFVGKFYRSGVVDDSLPLEEQTEEDVVILETVCDITESKHTNQSNFISSSYNVYFPIEKELKVSNGDLFKGMMYGCEINGKVVGVFATQLGGANAYIQDLDV